MSSYSPTHDPGVVSPVTHDLFLFSLSLFLSLSLSVSLSLSLCSFFENMARIVSQDYVPTEMDVLRVRIRTTGVIETQFKVKHLVFR